MTVKRWLCLLLLACGNKAPHEVAEAGPSETCVKARPLRDAAKDFEAKGHELLAKAKLDEANASCPDERASTAPLATAIDTALGVGSAASNGTEATARAKMHQAFAAEHAKDFVRAKTLWLDAWGELHPNPIALEAAGRAAGRAGDAVESRRLRDRALFEAEETEHATAKLTNRVRASVGAARLVGGTLTVGQNGSVVARDLASGELRALLDANIVGSMTLSPLASIAITEKWLHGDSSHSEVAVWDLLTRKRLLEDTLMEAFVSPDDELVLARAHDGSARVIDVETGAERAKLGGDVFAKVRIAGFDSHGRLLVETDVGDKPPTLRDWNLEKNAFGSFALAMRASAVGLSPSGRYLAYFPPAEVDAFDTLLPIEVRDLDASKAVGRVSGHFVPVALLGVDDDASLVLTQSNNSARLWSVASGKQTFIAERTRRGDNFASDLGVAVFGDDDKTLVLDREASTMLWDATTGKETLAVSNERHADVLGVTPLPDGGVAIVEADEVQIVPKAGDIRALCKGYDQRYYPAVGPTSVVLSPSGKSLACAMNAGAIHVFDTTTWAERSHFDGPSPGRTKGTFAGDQWDGVPPSVRPIDLAFSAGDATLTAVSDDAIVTFDASSGKQTSKIALRDPKLFLARRHARFSDGRVVVKTSSGAGALFDASGKRMGDLPLVAGAPLASPDAFSADGKTYAIAVGTTLHRVDLDAGTDRTTSLPADAVSVALSADGKSCAVVLRDGTAHRVGDALTKLDTTRARRAFFSGASLVVVSGEGDTLDLFGTSDTPRELEVDPNGVIARSSRGTFEARGQPETECVVGRFDLTQETCADRAESGLFVAWVQSLR
ncbi:MAG TPA: WD40 repeat domain-containing protein [Polyangiaceae bacterium]|jgi:WD40 repeat protein